MKIMVNIKKTLFAMLHSSLFIVVKIVDTIIVILKINSPAIKYKNII